MTRQRQNPSDKTLAPAFHLILDTCAGGKVYNLIIRGGNEAGLDGIDIWGFNIHIHDVEVSNKDECVTVKLLLLYEIRTQ
jgi:rhamnogalacturonan hydrolase